VAVGVSLYKVLFHFTALLWESIILFLPPLICNAYPIAIPAARRAFDHQYRRRVHLEWPWEVGEELASTRYSFTLRLLCTNQSSLNFPRPSALRTLLHSYRTTFAQYKNPPPTLPLYAIHHTLLVMTISCKGQVRSLRGQSAQRRKKS